MRRVARLPLAFATYYRYERFANHLCSLAQNEPAHKT